MSVFKTKTEEELLYEVKKRWQNHKDFLHLLIHLFSYIDRSYVVHQSLENLENKGMKAFKKFIFEDIRMKIIKIFVKELEKVSFFRLPFKMLLGQTRNKN